MRLETERLYLIPLTYDDLLHAVENRRGMTKRLGLDMEVTELDETMKRIYGIKAANIRNDKTHYLFYTYWQMMEKDDKKLIGEIGFKGIPNREGQVEVGYGTEIPYRNKGYMTEALKALLHWAFHQTIMEVTAVIACTEKDNEASRKVLQKAGLKAFKEDEKYVYWIIQKKGKKMDDGFVYPEYQ